MSANSDLRAFLGAPYRVVPLKSWRTRFRNRLKPWLIRLPRRSMAYRIDVADGRRYKLIRGSMSNLRARNVISDNARRLEGYEHAPRLVWLADTALLVEFIEGKIPDVRTPDFAERLGPAYASLHRMDAGTLTRDELIAQYVEHVVRLSEAGMLPDRAPQEFSRQLTDELPETIPTGMISNDPKADNFIEDADGRIFMIDLGAFQPDRPIDCILAGSDLYQQMDVAVFERSYLASGGEEFLFRGREALLRIELARHAERNLALLRGGLRADRRRRERFRRELDEMVGDLRSRLRL